MQVKINCLEKQEMEISSRGHKISTDLPQSLGGEDSSMTPPEIFLGSIGACIGVYARAYMRREKISYTQLILNIRSDIEQDMPKRIAEIDVSIQTDAQIIDREQFLAFIKNCPIHNTLKTNPTVNIRI